MDNLYSKIRYKRFACEYRFLGKKIIGQYMLPATRQFTSDGHYDKIKWYRNLGPVFTVQHFQQLLVFQLLIVRCFQNTVSIP